MPHCSVWCLCDFHFIVAQEKVAELQQQLQEKADELQNQTQTEDNKISTLEDSIAAIKEMCAAKIRVCIYAVCYIKVFWHKLVFCFANWY